MQKCRYKATLTLVHPHDKEKSVVIELPTAVSGDNRRRPQHRLSQSAEKRRGGVLHAFSTLESAGFSRRHSWLTLQAEVSLTRRIKWYRSHSETNGTPSDHLLLSGKTSEKLDECFSVLMNVFVTGDDCTQYGSASYVHDAIDVRAICLP